MVKGWEPVGNVCTKDTAKNRASPYCSLEKNNADCKTTGQWHGTWGYHWHTLYNLILRAEARWNRFSSNWESYDYVKFCGGTIWIPQYQDLNFMFNADTYWLSSHFANKNDNLTKEETWIHPGYMLHAPGTHLILSRRLTHHRGFYKIKIKVPTTWESYIPVKDAMDWVLWFWTWTWWDPERCFFEPCTDEPDSSCTAEPWWSQNNQLQSWVDRSQYQADNQASGKNWGPFLPKKQCSGNSSSFWFLYKLYFKFGGESVWAPVPRDPIVQGYIPGAPGNGRTSREAPGIFQLGPRALTGGLRPWTPHDILPGDLEDGMLLSDEALERITGRDEEGRHESQGEGPGRRQRQRHVGQRPPRHLPHRVRRLLLRLLRHRGDPASIDTPAVHPN